MKTLKKIAKKAINQFIDPSYPEDYGWPPTCSTLLYQPERPVMVKATEFESSNNSSKN